MMVVRLGTDLIMSIKIFSEENHHIRKVLSALSPNHQENYSMNDDYEVI